MDKCDSESDDADEVVAFVDESDSEMEVPVNTPGLVVLVHELAGYLYLIRATETGWHRYDINSQSSLNVLIRHVS